MRASYICIFACCVCVCVCVNHANVFQDAQECTKWRYQSKERDKIISFISLVYLVL